MAAILKRFNRFCSLTKLTEIFRQSTHVQKFFLIDQSVPLLSRSLAHTHKQKFFLSWVIGCCLFHLLIQQGKDSNGHVVSRNDNLSSKLPFCFFTQTIFISRAVWYYVGIVYYTTWHFQSNFKFCLEIIT